MCKKRAASFISLAMFCLWACLAIACQALATPEPDISQRATDAYNQSKLTEAIELYKQIITQKSDDPAAVARAKAQIGKCYQLLRQPETARGWFERVVAEHKADTEVASGAQYEIAICYKEESKMDMVIPALEKIISDYPAERGMCAIALTYKGEWQIMALRQYETAIVTLKKVLADYPDKKGVCRDAKMKLVFAYRCAGPERYGRGGAMTALDRVLEEYKDDKDICAHALWMKGKHYAGVRKFKEAVEPLKKLTSEYPDSDGYTAAKILLADAMIPIGRSNEARSMLTDMLDSEKYSHDQKGRITFLIGLSNMLEPAKAEEWFTKVITDFDDTNCEREAYHHRALLRIKRGAYDDALADIAMIKIPYCEQYVRGKYYFAQEKFAEAAECFEKVLPSLPNQKRLTVPADVPLEALESLVSCYTKLGDNAGLSKTHIQISEFELRIKAQFETASGR